MSKKYLSELVEFAQREMPSLQSDLQNASTQYSLQAATQRLFNVCNYMLHHIIHAAHETGIPVAPSTPIVAQAPVVVQPVAPVAVASPSGIPNLPTPGTITQPSVTPSALPGMPDASVVPGIANVFISDRGTKVVSPTGVTTTVPPGEHVGLEATTSTPPVPYSAPGEQTVVLPPGGGMSPEVLAALSQTPGG